jgi:hypothetical protein
MRFDFEPITTAFQADNVGVTLATQSRCEHGHLAFGLNFPGRWIGQNTSGLITPLPVILARCTASHMIGAINAFIAATEGPEAATAFNHEAIAAFDELAPVIHQLHAQGRDCCQAAYLTGGREHTCAQNGTQK